MIPLTFTRFLHVAAAVSGINPLEQAAWATGIAAATQVINLDGTGLWIGWDVVRTRASSTDQAEVTIANLPPVIRKALYQAWQAASAGPLGFKMGLYLGWDSITTLAFAGEVYEMIPERRQGVDVHTVIRMGDGYKSVEKNAAAPTVHTYGAGQSTVVWGLLVYMFGQLGLTIDPSQQPAVEAAVLATPLPVSGQISLEGEVSDVLDSLVASIGLEWKVIDGQVVFMAGGITASAQGATAVLLDAIHGLLEWEEAEAGGIRATALAQPSMRPGNQFVVADSFGIPLGAGYRCETVRFTGATDGESIMVIEGRPTVPL